MKVKVCGITTTEQLAALKTAGVDYAGLIFYEGSKRFAAPQLSGVAAAVKGIEIKKIGVFVNAEFEYILNAVNTYGLYGVQLHGDESDEFCLELMDKAKVIKVFRVGANQNIAELVAPFENVCDYFLFDTYTDDFGGSGLQFDWNGLRSAEIKKPFFLSGGIRPEDVEKVKAFQHPLILGVDVNSRFETAPGIKNMDAVREFVRKVNQDELI